MRISGADRDCQEIINDQIRPMPIVRAGAGCDGLQRRADARAATHPGGDDRNHDNSNSGTIGHGDASFNDGYAFSNFSAHTTCGDRYGGACADQPARRAFEPGGGKGS